MVKYEGIPSITEGKAGLQEIPGVKTGQLDSSAVCAGTEQETRSRPEVRLGYKAPRLLLRDPLPP